MNEKRFNPNWSNINQTLSYIGVGVSLLIGLTAPLAHRQQLTDAVEREFNRRGYEDKNYQ